MKNCFKSQGTTIVQLLQELVGTSAGLQSCVLCLMEFLYPDLLPVAFTQN